MRGERRRRPRQENDLEPPALEQLAHELTDGLFVVDDEHAAAKRRTTRDAAPCIRPSLDRGFRIGERHEQDTEERARSALEALVTAAGLEEPVFGERFESFRGTALEHKFRGAFEVCGMSFRARKPLGARGRPAVDR